MTPRVRTTTWRTASILVCLVLSLNHGYAQSNQPSSDLAGYSGIPWGVASDQIRGKITSGLNHFSELWCDGEYHLSITEKITSQKYEVSYVFQQDGNNLQRVDISIPTWITTNELQRESKILEAELSQRYGKPALVRITYASLGSFKVMTWKHPTTHIELGTFTYSNSDSGRILVRYSPSHQKKHQDIKPYLHPGLGEQ